MHLAAIKERLEELGVLRKFPRPWVSSKDPF